MKLILNEAYGESDELDTFVYQLNKRFYTFYEVILKVRKDVSRKYFAYEDAAKEYYDKLKEEANNDKDYYEGSEIILNKIDINQEQDELESIYIENEDDDYSDEETDIEIAKQD
jgi:hypothetical protein